MEIRDYWRLLVLACLILLALHFVNGGWLTDYINLSEWDKYVVIGLLSVAIVFMIVDRIFAKPKRMSKKERFRRREQGEVLSDKRSLLVVAAVGLTFFTDYVKPGAGKPLFFFGFAGILLFCAARALMTGILPLRICHIDRQSSPVSFWVFTLLHLTAVPGLVWLYFYAKN